MDAERRDKPLSYQYADDPQRLASRTDELTQPLEQVQDLIATKAKLESEFTVKSDMVEQFVEESHDHASTTKSWAAQNY